MASKVHVHARRPSFRVHAIDHDTTTTHALDVEGASWTGNTSFRREGSHPAHEHGELSESLMGATLSHALVAEAWSRGRWLVGLLVLQSSSSFVLDSYADLLREHLVVTLFLTMLVGAGGNAGNQSAIKIIRGLATGALQPTLGTLRIMLGRQMVVGLLLSSGLASAGWVRVFLTSGNPVHASAIALSLFLIVNTSVFVGTALPFVLARVGLDPANAGTSIQVVMDVTGVLITCTCCNIILNKLSTIVVRAPPS